MSINLLHGAGIAVLVLGVAALREWWLLVVLPRRAHQFHVRGETREAIRLLERLVDKKSVLGATALAGHRIALGNYLAGLGEHTRAVGVFRKSLEWAAEVELELDVRHALARSLEALGDREGARRESERVWKLLATAKPETLLVRANILEEEHHDYEEARRTLLRLLERPPLGMGEQRPVLALRAAHCATLAGRPEEALPEVERFLEGRPELSLRRMALEVAGSALVAMGDLDAAEQRWRQALDLAQQEGNPAQIASEHVQLAETLLRQGRGADALAHAERAESHAQASRIAARMRSTLHTEQEAWDQARVQLANSRSITALADPQWERQSLGHVAMAQASLELEAGDPDAARRFLDEARTALARDRRLALVCDSLSARIASLEGRHAEALALLVEVQKDLRRLPHDRVSWLHYETAMSIVRHEAGDYEAARDHVHRALGWRPDPLAMPRLYYRLGQCLLALGDRVGARTALRQSLEFPFSTRASRAARALLEQLA